MGGSDDKDSEAEWKRRWAEKKARPTPRLPRAWPIHASPAAPLVGIQEFWYEKSVKDLQKKLKEVNEDLEKYTNKLDKAADDDNVGKYQRKVKHRTQEKACRAWSSGAGLLAARCGALARRAPS